MINRKFTIRKHSYNAILRKILIMSESQSKITSDDSLFLSLSLSLSFILSLDIFSFPTYMNVTWARNTKWCHTTLTRLMRVASGRWSTQARRISQNNLMSKEGSHLDDERDHHFLLPYPFRDLAYTHCVANVTVRTTDFTINVRCICLSIIVHYCIPIINQSVPDKRRKEERTWVTHAFWSDVRYNVRDNFTSFQAFPLMSSLNYDRND